MEAVVDRLRLGSPRLPHRARTRARAIPASTCVAQDDAFTGYRDDLLTDPLHLRARVSESCPFRLASRASVTLGPLGAGRSAHDITVAPTSPSLRARGPCGCPSGSGPGPDCPPSGSGGSMSYPGTPGDTGCTACATWVDERSGRPSPSSASPSASGRWSCSAPWPTRSAPWYRVAAPTTRTRSPSATSRVRWAASPVPRCRSRPRTSSGRSTASTRSRLA